MIMSSVAFYNAKLGEGFDVGDRIDASLGIWGVIKILVERSIASAIVVETILYRNLNEKSSDKVVEGKRCSTLLAVAVDRKIKIYNVSRVIY